MRALLLLSVTIDGSWKSVGYDQNLRGIHILSEKLKQWTLHGYLFYVLNMPVVHEVNNDGNELFVDNGDIQNENNHGIYQDDNDQGPDPL